jgi:hypothetical protein
MAAANPEPAEAVDPNDYFDKDVFSQSIDVNSLGVNYELLTNNISMWIDQQVTMGPGHVIDKLSEFLLSSFTTLLTTYEPPSPYRGKIYTGLTTSDVLIVKNKLKEKLKGSLDDLVQVKNTAKYTEFCCNFFGKMTCVEARAILEVLDPDPQCNALVESKKFCWICGLELNDRPKPECEHILPISDALLHLNLYQNRSLIEKLNKYEVNMLKLEYLWAHQCCNQSKNNIKYITSRHDKYAIDHAGIDMTIDRIRTNAGSSVENSSYDCHSIFGKNVRNNKKFKHLTNDRISKYIHPIVETINLHIRYIQEKGNIDRQKAFLVYEYLILIRFFCRIPGCTLVEAFKEYFLSDNVASRDSAQAEEKKMRNEIERIKKEKKEAQNARRAEAAASADARRKEAAQKILKLQEEASRKLREAISGGLTRAQRYAKKVQEEEKEEKKESVFDSSEANIKQIHKITSEENTINVIATTQLEDDILDTVTGITDDTGLTTGGTRKTRILSSDTVIPPRQFLTTKGQSGVRLEERHRRAMLIKNVETLAIRTMIYKMYEETGKELDKLLGESDVFTDQDVDNLHILYTLPKMNISSHTRYTHSEVLLHGIIQKQSEIDKTIASGVKSMPQAGGTRPNIEKPIKIDPYAIIQIDFTTEKAFIFLLAYYPVHLRLNNLRSISADQYMSTPHILRDTLKYFGADLAEYQALLRNDARSVSLSKQPEQQNFTAFYAALKEQRRSTNPIVYRESFPLPQAVRSFGGKRRTKRRTKKHAKKRRTRKN